VRFTRHSSLAKGLNKPRYSKIQSHAFSCMKVCFFHQMHPLRVFFAKNVPAAESLAALAIQENEN